MACTYTVNGKEVSEDEYAQYILSAKSQLTLNTESNDALVERMKDASKDIFVNMDLFTPLQEQSYTNVITSQVIDKLGVLTPGQEIRISPARVFENIRGEFENGANKFKVLAERLNTPELLAMAKGNPEMLAKFPELAIYTPQGLKDLADHYAHVADPENFNKFKEQTLVKLSQAGIQVVDGKLNEVGETDLSTTARLQDDETGLDDTARITNQSFEDGQSFKTNPRDTASARVKLFLMDIPAPTKNVFNMRDYVSPDEVTEQILKIGSTLPVVNYETLQKALMDNSEKVPYLKSVSAKLSKVFQDRNQAFINDFLTFANKVYNEHDMNTWERTDNGVKNKLFKSNRNSTINQIRSEWMENMKNADIITRDEHGNMLVDKEKVQALKDQLAIARNAGQTEKRQFVKDFFKAQGIDFTDPMLGDLYKNAEAKKFRQYNARNFNDLFGTKSAFANVLDTYLKEPSGKTESSYEDSNNAMKEEKVFNDFAKIFYEYNTSKYQTSSFRNGEGKSIYSYNNPTMLEDIKKKITQGSDYTSKLLNKSFSRSSEFIKKIAAGDKFNFDLRYMDSLKKDDKNADAKVRKDMSDKEQLADMVWKHQNSGNTSGIYNGLTLSDKTKTPTIHFTKVPINKGTDIAFTNKNTREGSFELKQPIKDQLYKVAQAEIDRMTDYAKNPDKMNLKNFNETQGLFYLSPILNDSETYAGLKDIHQRIADGKELSEEQTQYVKDILADTFKKRVLDSFDTWTNAGLIEPVRNEETLEVQGYNFPLMNEDYMAKLDGLTDYEKAIHSIIDQKLNNDLAQLTFLQTTGMDPALFYKAPKGEHGKAIKDATKSVTDSDGNVTRGNVQDAPFESKYKAVQSTMDDFSKRAAMLIAPGSKGVWTWHDSKGMPVDRSNYKTITLDTWKNDTPLFKGVDVTDAQEFITVKEHIDRMMAEGRIPLKTWESISQKISDAKGDYYELSPEEKKVVFQPTKPVYTLNSDENGFNKIDYVKSSTMPLLPGILAGTELDGLRSYMEQNDIASANFDSAKKTGQPGAALQAFDEKGNFITPDENIAAKAIQTLSRDGLRTQQEIPDQKDEITNISQLNRNLFDGLLHVNDFNITDSDGVKHTFTGNELKQLKENVRTRMFELAQKQVIDRLGLKNEGGKFKFNDNQKLLNLLREEAIRQKYSQNDINSLQLDQDGNFKFPLYLLSSGEKFEGLLNSVISSTVQLHNPGTSLVQASGVGQKIDFGKLSDQQKSEIIWTNRFDESKGLQYLHEENGQVRGAQVLISQFIKDHEGNLIDMKKFATLKDGKYTLDDEKVPESILQLIGARIPNQNHSSDLPLEVAGFLPEYMANTVITPDGITAQMGSDFDVDKLYTYLSSLKFDRDKDGNVSKINKVDYSLGKYDGSHESLHDLDNDQLNELYKDINWNVLTHKEGFNKIARSIDLPEVKQEVNNLDFLNKTETHWSPLDAEYQMKVFNDNKGGKTGVAIFASLGSFLADNQDKGLFVGKVVYDKFGGRHEVRNPIYVKDTDGKLLDLSEISKPGSTRIDINGKMEKRTKSDNNNVALNESVDNAKNKNMGVFNWHPRVLNALSGFIALSTPEGKIHDITFGTRLFLQDVVKQYVTHIERMTDSFAEDRVANAHKLVIGDLRDEMMNNMSGEAAEAYRADEEENPQKLALSAKELLDMLHVDPASLYEIANHPKTSDDDRQTARSQLDEYYRHQLNVLDTFDRFDEVGKEIMKANTAAYVYTKGLGSTVFHVNDKLRKLQNLADSSVIGNLENLAGKVAVDPLTKDMVLQPKGEIGNSLQRSVMMARDIYKDIYPLHFGNAWFDNVVDKIFTLSGFDKNTMGSDGFINQHRKIFSGVKSYLFSKPELGVFDNIKDERERLLFNRDGNQSLGVHIQKMMQDNPELQNNYFMQRLRVRTANIPGDPDLLTYQAPFSTDIDEASNKKGFLSLILSGKDDQVQLAKDLAKYSMVVGNDQNATSFARFIPIEYYMGDKTFTDGLQRLAGDLHDNDEFVRQYIQNNPNNGWKLTPDDYKMLVKKGSMGSFEIPKSADELFSSNDDIAFPTKLPEMLTFNTKEGPELYAKMGGIDSNKYERINTLGTKKAGIVEYSYGEPFLESNIASNRTPWQKLEAALTNGDNPYHSVAPSKLQNKVADVAMGDVATQYIGNIDEDKKVWGTKTNTGDYKPTDKIMVNGPREIEEGDKTFENQYKPLLDKAIAAGSEILVGNRAGMDQLTRSYLKEEGYVEQKSELGFSTFSEKVLTEPDEVDYDDDYSDVYEQWANEDHAQSTGSIQDAFGSKDEGDEVSPITGDEKLSNAQAAQGLSMFGISNPRQPFEETTFNPNDTLAKGYDDDHFAYDDDDDLDMDDLDEHYHSLPADEETGKAIVSKYLPDLDGNNNLSDVLKSIGTNTQDPFYKTLTDLLSRTAIPDINVVSTDMIQDPGVYRNGTIMINPEVAMVDNPNRSADENIQDVIMHEALHGYTASLLKRSETNKTSLNPRELVYTAALKQLFRDAHDSILNHEHFGDGLRSVLEKIKEPDATLTPEEKSLYYGLTNVHEFASMLFTDRGFQQLMNDTAAKNQKNLSVLERFRDILLTLFTTLSKSLGVDIKGNSVLEQGVNDMLNLLGSREPGPIHIETAEEHRMDMPTDIHEPFKLDNQC
jgi:hypothetical protein